MLYGMTTNSPLMCRCKPYGMPHVWEPGESCNPVRVDPDRLTGVAAEKVRELLGRYDAWSERREALSSEEEDAYVVDWTESDDEGTSLAHELASALRADCACAILSPSGICRRCGQEWKAVR